MTRLVLLLVWLSLVPCFPAWAAPRAEDAASDTAAPAAAPSPADPRDDREVSFERDPALRPCCAFGHDLRVTVEKAEVSVKIDNVVNPRHLGHHSYRHQNISTEQNGLIYTCRGGVIDLAHVRDNADRTAYLYVRLARALGSSLLIPVYDEGGKREILLKPAKEIGALSENERRLLALRLAMRISYQMSVWHEIATWYGFASVKEYPEKVSAFSPEDISSNALGVMIGGEVLETAGVYDDLVDARLKAHLDALHPLPPGQTKKVLDNLDGLWWDSTKLLPDNRMVMRRNLGTASPVRPWTLNEAFAPYCRGRNDPAAFPIPDHGPGGLVLDSLYELRFHVDPAVMPSFPMPDTPVDYVTQADFPDLEEQIREDVRREFGPYGDRSGTTLADVGAFPKPTLRDDRRFPCGRDDPDCSFARSEKLNALKIGAMDLGGGSFPGLLFGAATARLHNMGGGFDVFDIQLHYDARRNDYIFFLKGMNTDDTLLLCSVEAEDGSGRTRIDFPFVNPFASKCVGGSLIGINLGVLEWYRDNHLRKTGLRPIDLGLAFNLLANGHTQDYLSRHVLLSLGFAPESIQMHAYSSRPNYLYTSLIWHQLFYDNRLGTRLFSQFREDLSHPDEFSAQLGGRLIYNFLWNHRDLRGGSPLHHLFSFGLEGSVSYWRNMRNQMPGLEQLFVPAGADFLPDRFHLTYQAITFIETSIPTLGVF